MSLDIPCPDDPMWSEGPSGSTPDKQPCSLLSLQEGEEARRTLEAQTEHDKRRAEYKDQVGNASLSKSINLHIYDMCINVYP